jgi:hypothetical protein
MAEADVKTTVVLPGTVARRLRERAKDEKRDMRQIVVGALEVYLSVPLGDIEAWTAERYDKLYGEGTSRARAPLVDCGRTLEAWLAEYRGSLPRAKKGGTR